MRIKSVNVPREVSLRNFVALRDAPNAWLATSHRLLCQITGEKRAKGCIYNVLGAPIAEESDNDVEYLALIPVIEEIKGTLDEVREKLIDLMYGEIFKILKLPTESIIGIEEPKERYEELQ